MNSVQSHDQRYLDFNAKARPVFEKFPHIEPLRHFIFRQLLIQRSPLRWREHLKHWVRPLVYRKPTQGPIKQADVLIWVEGTREVVVDALLPVYRELVSRGVKVRLVSCGGPANLPPATIRFQCQARALSPFWAKEVWKALCGVGGELWDKSLDRSFYYACSDIQALLGELERILEAVQPKLVLNASTQLMGGSGLVFTSRSRGVLTLLLQHGMLHPMYVPIFADYMVIWGQSSNEILSSLGVPIERLVALGSPRHDSMAQLANGHARSAFLRALSLRDRPTLVFFSNGNDLVRNGSAPRECARWIEKTAAQYSDVINVVVRLHPNEDGSLYRDCRHIRITKDCPALPITLDGCDWVGSLCSTVLYDALLYKKPVWQFYADGWPELAENWKYGLALRISSQSELSEMVGRMLHASGDHYAKEDLSARVFKNHGKAYLAIADLVQNHLEAAASPPSVEMIHARKLIPSRSRLPGPA